MIDPGERGVRVCTVRQDRVEGDPAEEISRQLSVAFVARLKQVHGATVHSVQAAGDEPPPYPEGDALVTDRPEAAVAVITADCVPVLLWDRSGSCVAAVHAGWRGAAQGVVAAAIARMGELSGVAAVDLQASLGPAAGGCCYEVGDEVIAALRRTLPAGEERFILPGRRGKPHVDLREAVRLQLVSAGLPAGAVAVWGPCTICGPDSWPSYRRDGKAASRIWSAIAPRRSASPGPGVGQS